MGWKVTGRATAFSTCAPEDLGDFRVRPVTDVSTSSGGAAADLVQIYENLDPVFARPWTHSFPRATAYGPATIKCVAMERMEMVSV
ncbi:MAG: hypothetical protein CMJ39_00795 [Phycisphaerae bacterium]|nr:hypothetical protein [Phycisphaerae bacterium]